MAGGAMNPIGVVAGQRLKSAINSLAYTPEGRAAIAAAPKSNDPDVIPQPLLTLALQKGLINQTDFAQSTYMVDPATGQVVDNRHGANTAGLKPFLEFGAAATGGTALLGGGAAASGGTVAAGQSPADFAAGSTTVGGTSAAGGASAAGGGAGVIKKGASTAPIVSAGLGSLSSIYGAKKQSAAQDRATQAQQQYNDKALAAAQEEQQYQRQKAAEQQQYQRQAQNAYAARLQPFANYAPPAMSRLNDLLQPGNITGPAR